MDGGCWEAIPIIFADVHLRKSRCKLCKAIWAFGRLMGYPSLSALIMPSGSPLMEHPEAMLREEGGPAHERWESHLLGSLISTIYNPPLIGEYQLAGN